MANGKKFVNEYRTNNYGFTRTSSLEGNPLKCKYIFWKVSAKEEGYFRMETESNMFPVLQQLMPQMTEGAWKEFYENDGIAMK